MVRILATVSGWKGTEPTISVGRRRAIFSIDSLRQQSPNAGKPRTGATSAHHRVTATRCCLAPSAQRMDVQDGASETMRNAPGRFEFWREAMIQQNSKDDHANLTRRDSRARTAQRNSFSAVIPRSAATRNLSSIDGSREISRCARNDDLAIFSSLGCQG
jgi:hypothetical protein